MRCLRAEIRPPAPALPGIGAVIEGLLKDNRLIPGNAVDGKVADAAPLRRKRKLFQHGVEARKHLRLAEARKPDTQVKAISHKSKDAIVNFRCVLRRPSGLISARK